MTLPNSKMVPIAEIRQSYCVLKASDKKGTAFCLGDNSAVQSKKIRFEICNLPKNPSHILAFCTLKFLAFLSNNNVKG